MQVLWLQACSLNNLVVSTIINSPAAVATLRNGVLSSQTLVSWLSRNFNFHLHFSSAMTMWMWIQNIIIAPVTLASHWNIVPSTGPLLKCSILTSEIMFITTVPGALSAVTLHDPIGSSPCWIFEHWAFFFVCDSLNIRLLQKHSVICFQCLIFSIVLVSRQSSRLSNIYVFELSMLGILFPDLL